MEVNNTTFLCPNCHKEIPLINRVVHSLRCHPSNDVNASESIIPIAIPVHDEDHAVEHAGWSEVTMPQPSCPSSSLSRDWTCSRCTFINNIGNSSCEMCGEPHSHEIPAAHPPPQEADSAAPAGASSDSNSWSCPLCTFHNDRQQRECAMCGSTAPPLPSYQDQLISDDNDYNDDDDDGRDSDVIFIGRSNVNDSNPTGGGGRSSSNTRRQPSNPILDSALLGAGIGAGLALLTNRNVFGGAVQGAGVGALGGLVVHSMDARRMRPRMMNEPISLGRPLIRNGMMLEELLQVLQSEMESSNGGRGAQPSRALDPSIIDHLPVRTFQPPPSSSSSNNRGEVASSCTICLCPFEAGDQVKTLPCLHLYHTECIDRWLQRSSICPVCKHDVSTL